jgi:ABC-2 type transport system ATP-binding protein
MIAIGDKNELKLLSNSEENIKIELESNENIPLSEIRQLFGVSEVVVCDNTLQISSHNAHNILQSVIEILVRSGLRINNINLNSPSMENVFLTLTGRKLRD